jgi:hypothetical protein
MKEEKLHCTWQVSESNYQYWSAFWSGPKKHSKSKLFTDKIVTAPVIFLRYCMVDLCNVDTLEKVWFYAEGAQVNQVQLNVIGWLSKTRMEKLNGTCLFVRL